MSDKNDAQTELQTPEPSQALKQLGINLGTWGISGPEIQGQVTFEWIDGGFFLIQHVDLDHNGRKIKGIEIIGHERKFGATEASKEIKSRFYDNVGNTLDYVYELEGDTLTVWGGEKGSPAYYRGKFSDDGNILTGAWVWPGGGYESTATRVK